MICARGSGLDGGNGGAEEPEVDHELSVLVEEKRGSGSGDA